MSEKNNLLYKKTVRTLITVCVILAFLLLISYLIVVFDRRSHDERDPRPGVPAGGLDDGNGRNDGDNGIIDSKTVFHKGHATTSIEQAYVIMNKYGGIDARPQFVLFAFDGSRSLKMWRDSRSFAKVLNASGTPMHFTYFINAVYLLDPEFHSRFKSPGQKAGFSNIGLGDNKEDVLARIAEINAAYAEGHEIGSHNTGHFEGQNWTYGEWKGQFDLFDEIVFNSELMRPEYQINIKPADLVGFRAPNLSVNGSMFLALKDKGFLYDASLAAGSHTFPYKDSNGLWQLSLPTVTIGPGMVAGKTAGTLRYSGRSQVLAMDYNLFLRDTAGKDIVKKGTERWDQIFKDTTTAFDSYFDTEYKGKRAPVYFASHFSSWNDGVYWESMKDLARKVCGKPEVYCVTYKDLAMWMEAREILGLGIPK